MLKYTPSGHIDIGGDYMLIDVTAAANEELKKIIQAKKTDKSLRIYVAGYGWGGPSFGIALDELKDGDQQIKVDDFNFLIGDELTDTYGKFTLDYSDDWLKRGFNITPDVGGGSC